MTAIRVLQIVHDHRHWTAGGSEFVAHDLSEALRERGVRVRVLAAATRLQRAPTDRIERIGDDLVTWIGSYDRLMMSRLDAGDWADGLRMAVAHLAPTVIHFHNLDRLGVETLAVAHSAAPRARIVLTLHDYQSICANDGLMLTTNEGARCSEASADRCHRCFPRVTAERFVLRQKWLASHLRLVDAFIAPTRYVRDRYVAWGVDPDRIGLIPNAVAVRDAAETPAADSLCAGRRNRFAYFGAIAPHKGVLTLLDAAARLSAAKADVTITLQGGLGHADDQWRARFVEAVEKSWPVASYAGPYPRDEVVGLMRQADWIVLPSLWWEAAPLVVTEAFHAGRPVICSGAGALAEMVRDGIDGIHTPPGDACALATTLARAAADPALWTRLRENIRRPFSMEQFVAAHLSLYEALAGRAAA